MDMTLCKKIKMYGCKGGCSIPRKERRGEPWLIMAWRHLALEEEEYPHEFSRLYNYVCSLRGGDSISGRRASSTEVNSQGGRFFLMESMATCSWLRQIFKLDISCDFYLERDGLHQVYLPNCYALMNISLVSTQTCGGYWLVAQLHNNPMTTPCHGTGGGDDDDDELVLNAIYIWNIYRDIHLLPCKISFFYYICKHFFKCYKRFSQLDKMSNLDYF